jgi:hypothetical protein
VLYSDLALLNDELRVEATREAVSAKPPGVQVGQQLYERVPVYMRTQLWKSLLIHSDTAAAAAAAAAAADRITVCDAACYNHLLEVRPWHGSACGPSRPAAFRLAPRTVHRRLHAAPAAPSPPSRLSSFEPPPP